MPATTDQPERSFRDLGLSDGVLRALDELGYQTPTDVQWAVFSQACAGNDLVVQARTGTGKTTAFGLPLINSLVKPSTDAIQALVLCPTRELALQVTSELIRLASHSSLQVVPIYGGAPMGAQTEALRAGPHIVVGTPGRVLDHLERGTLKLSRTSHFILDESDEMLSMGFLPQINAIWERLPAQRQVLLFSATVPREVLRVADSRLKNPSFITLSGDQIGALQVSHFLYYSQGNKLDELLQILEVEDPDSGIIFCNTRDETKRVAAALIQKGYSTDWLNADLTQAEREKVMLAIREHKLRFLVCTDVAARGIDISHLTHVINYDFPESTDQYVHRTGRTGRAGRMGTAISLVAPGSVGDLYYLKLRYKIDPIERQLPSPAERRAREETDLLTQLASQLPAKSELSLRLCRRLLTRDDAEELLARLVASQLPRPDESLAKAADQRRTREPSPVRPAEPAPSRSEPQRRPRPALTPAKPALSPWGGPKPGRLERADWVSRPRTPDTSGRRSSRHTIDGIGYTVSETPETSGHADLAPQTSLPAVAEGAASGAYVGSNGRRPAPAERFANGVPEDAAELSEIYVNVGRRDGVTEADFIELLGKNGVQLQDSSCIKVRQAHTFVSVREELVENVIHALNGASIANKLASAERAKSRAAR